MLHLNVWLTDSGVAWHLVKVRPAREWRAAGPWYWERRGHVNLDEAPTSDRQVIRAALQAVMDRLGER